MIVGVARPPNSSDVVSLLGSQPMSSTRLPCLRHHVGQVGEREALAAAALAVDGDDLRFLGRRLSSTTGSGSTAASGRRKSCIVGRDGSGGSAPATTHEHALQSKIILRHDGSLKAVR